MASLSLKTFNCFPLDLKPIDLIFLYIDFECFLSTPKVTKLQLELESPFEINFSFSSLELLYFFTAIFMVCTGFLFRGCKYLVSFLNFQLIVYFFVFIFTIFLHIIVFYLLKIFMPKELECVLLI